MLQFPTHRAVYSIVTLAIVAIFLLSINPDSFGMQRVPVSASSEHPFDEHHTAQLSQQDINRVTNNTLGFSKIFVVGLPERTNKRDAFALISALNCIRVDFIDAVRGQDVPGKALPLGVD